MLVGEFGPDANVVAGRLHEAYEPSILTFAHYPIEEAESAVAIVQDTAIYVQVYLPWQRQDNVLRVVDPAPVEDAIQRFREALQAHTHPYLGATPQNWRIGLARVDYAFDPVGNVTRATMTITAYGQNLAETGL